MDYKKILEGVVNIINTTEKSDIGFANICAYIDEKCPELKESEDESIRKALITFFQRFPYERIDAAGTNVKEAIAWLERQGSEPNWCHHKVDLSNCSEEYRKAYYDGWNNCNMQYSQCKSESNDVLKCLINGMKFYYEDNAEATWGTEKFSMKVKDILSWLEKQGKNNMGISEATKKKLEDNLNKALEKETPESWNEFLEKQGEQKPADKIEPKFKVGDWITNGDYTWKIVEVNPLDYILQSQDGNVVDDTISHVDEQFHSFTPEDAKDGDVLAFKNNIGGIIICKSSTNYDTRSYCRLVNDNLINKEEGGWDSTLLVPATKEQSDLLFQKMHESGYEWDAEKLQLKKIEQKLSNNQFTLEQANVLDKHIDKFIEQNPAWSEEDETTRNNISHIIRQYDKISKRNNQPCWYVGDCLLWMQNIKGRVQPQPKQEWSDKDEKMIHHIENAIKYDKSRTYLNSKGIEIIDVCNWLKSLKDRVQPKQEWSEEDKKLINDTCHLINTLASGYGEKVTEPITLLGTQMIASIKDRLRALVDNRPQNTWKPSDEQMDALRYVTNFDYGGHKAILVSLYEQLKKLREK